MKFLALFLVAFAVIAGVQSFALRADHMDHRCTDDGYCMITFGEEWKCKPADFNPNTKDYRCSP